MDSIPIFLNLVKTTIDQRGHDYGTPAENLKRISILWSMHLEFDISEYDVAIMMTMLKLARNANDHKDDNLLDAAAYLALADSVKETARC
jgi:Domain of unknown function (DUF6378)